MHTKLKKSLLVSSMAAVAMMNRGSALASDTVALLLPETVNPHRT